MDYTDTVKSFTHKRPEPDTAPPQRRSEMQPINSLIREHFRVKKAKWPTVEEALMWTQTELAEVYELLLAKEGGWVRNNPDKHPPYSDEALAEELGDAIYMLMVAGMVANVDPLVSMIEKMKAGITREMNKVLHPEEVMI